VKVGDLIRDKEHGDIGLIVEICWHRMSWYSAKEEPYLILGPNGKKEWFEVDYVNNSCEVVNGGGQPL
jgi:hypothetical protein